MKATDKVPPQLNTVGSLVHALLPVIPEQTDSEKMDGTERLTTFLSEIYVSPSRSKFLPRPCGSIRQRKTINIFEQKELRNL